MNIELLKRLRTRFLRMRHPEHFDMGVWANRNECGTAMCIAGHALDLQGYKVTKKSYAAFSVTGNLQFLTPNGERIDDPLTTAAQELGIDRELALKLFKNDGTITTPQQAAARIQELIHSAEVSK